MSLKKSPMALGRRRKGIWPCLVQRVKPPLGVVFEEAEILEVEVGGWRQDT
jgi:hypothetical protein